MSDLSDTDLDRLEGAVVWHAEHGSVVTIIPEDMARILSEVRVGRQRQDAVKALHEALMALYKFVWNGHGVYDDGTQPEGYMIVTCAEENFLSDLCSAVESQLSTVAALGGDQKGDQRAESYRIADSLSGPEWNQK